ncbi:MAG TPA: glucose-6-phosphate dehydrogenase assembly protein OpcA [Thermoleophilaceae bacterium]|nr:glucose-6-phosphate dehydrogenase assembly protein OpcA [Thermoleophilaceae bacterium]
MAPQVVPEVPDTGAVWSEQDTTPGAIDEALRGLLQQQHARDHAHAPARVLNLVVVVDREWRGEILNRLERVGRYHASRTILCAVEPGRTTIDASVVMTIEGERRPGDLALTRERVILEVGPKHLEKLDTIVDPLFVTDLPTVVWSPHGHPEAVDALLHLSQVILIDSVNEPDPASALRRAEELAAEAYVVDLAWLRTTPWRERVAFTFDPPKWREELSRIDAVTVRHRPDSSVAGVLFFGWLGSRLGWGAGSLLPVNGSVRGRARARRHDVTLTLEPDPQQSVPGLAGIEIGTSSGMSISLDRGPGGLVARRRDRAGREQRWTILGASRGEGGILGEGIRQALLRDPAYRGALDCAEAMLR